MLLQNYGWPAGPTKIWRWLPDGRLGGLGPPGSTTPVIHKYMHILQLENLMVIPIYVH